MRRCVCCWGPAGRWRSAGEAPDAHMAGGRAGCCGAWACPGVRGRHASVAGSRPTLHCHTHEHLHGVRRAHAARLPLGGRSPSPGMTPAGPPVRTARTRVRRAPAWHAGTSQHVLQPRRPDGGGVRPRGRLRPGSSCAACVKLALLCFGGTSFINGPEAIRQKKKNKALNLGSHLKHRSPHGLVACNCFVVSFLKLHELWKHILKCMKSCPECTLHSARALQAIWSGVD